MKLNMSIVALVFLTVAIFTNSTNPSFSFVALSVALAIYGCFHKVNILRVACFLASAIYFIEAIHSLGFIEFTFRNYKNSACIAIIIFFGLWLLRDWQKINSQPENT